MFPSLTGRKDPGMLERSCLFPGQRGLAPAPAWHCQKQLPGLALATRPEVPAALRLQQTLGLLPLGAMP